MTWREPDYDAYITNPRYSRAVGWVTCPACGEETLVTATSEYGRTEWDPFECEIEGCGREFTGDEPWREDEPPEPDYPPEPPEPWE